MSVVRSSGCASPGGRRHDRRTSSAASWRPPRTAASTDRSDTPARVTFPLAAAEAARGIDGKFAGGLSGSAASSSETTPPAILASKIPKQRQLRRRIGLHEPHVHEDDGDPRTFPESRPCFKKASSPAWARRAQTAVCPDLGLDVHDQGRNHGQKIRPGRPHRRHVEPASRSYARAATTD